MLPVRTMKLRPGGPGGCWVIETSEALSGIFSDVLVNSAKVACEALTIWLPG